MAGKNPLNIYAFWDTRAGHIKQTRGIISSLKSMTNIHVKDIKVDNYSLKYSIANWIRFFSLPSIFFQSSKNLKADLIIGTGTHTHLPMLLLQRKIGGKVITCMTPEWPLKNWMDLCFIPEHDEPGKNQNVFPTFGPPNTAQNENRHIADHGLIVIGGEDKKTHKWDNKNIIFQIKEILITENKIKWVISTSPRTPKNLFPIIKSLIDINSNTKFIPFEETRKGWIEQMYSKSRYTWVTEDSVSMVYEALSAGCCVGVLPIQWKKKKNKFIQGIELLVRQNKIITFNMWKETREFPMNSQLNEAERCAKEILKRWWPDRLR